MITVLSTNSQLERSLNSKSYEKSYLEESSEQSTQIDSVQ